MKVSVDVDAKGAFRKLDRAQRGTIEFARTQTKKWTKQAFNYARAVMPKWSKQTYRAMDYEVRPIQKGAQGIILVHPVVRGELNYDNQPLSAVDLVTIMESGKWGRFKTKFKGNPYFMAATRNYLEAITKQDPKSALRAHIK